MKKILLAIIILVSFGLTSNAQISPFKPVRSHFLAEQRKVIYSATSPSDSVFNAWRFNVSLVGYTIPDKLLLSGVGFGYTHIKYSFATQTATTVWGVYAVMWATGATQPTNPASATSFGVDVTAIKGLVHAGWAYNPGLKSGQFEAGVSLPLN